MTMNGDHDTSAELFFLVILVTWLAWLLMPPGNGRAVWHFVLTFAACMVAKWTWSIVMPPYVFLSVVALAYAVIRQFTA